MRFSEGLPAVLSGFGSSTPDERYAYEVLNGYYAIYGRFGLLGVVALLVPLSVVCTSSWVWPRSIRAGATARVGLRRPRGDSQGAPDVMDATRSYEHGGHLRHGSICRDSLWSCGHCFR